VTKEVSGEKLRGVDVKKFRRFRSLVWSGGVEELREGDLGLRI